MNIGLERYRYYYETLREGNLFKEIPHYSLHQLLEISSAQYWPKKKCILDTHDQVFYFYIIISGKLKAYNFDMHKDRQLTLFLLGKNDVFDIFSLLKPSNQSIYYETLSKTEVLSIPITALKQWMQEHNAFAESLLPYLINKMRILQECVCDIVLEDTPTRLAKLLFQNMNSNSGKIEKINDLSHTEIAALIGTTRAVVNRHIQHLKEEGILKVSSKQMEITNLELLKTKFQTHSIKAQHMDL